MKKNPLEEIYSNQVLLNEEEKSNVVAPVGKQEISKSGKVGLTPGGTDKVKKDLKDPEENEKYSDGPEGKDIETLKDSKEVKSYEGAFEKLFKSTLNEDMEEDMAMDLDVEVPTSDEDMVDELEDNNDEVTDLVSDLKSVMDHLQSILNKIGEEEDSAPDAEEEMEFGDEEMEDEEMEDDSMKEAVEFEDHGHALVNAKSGKSLCDPKSNNKVGSVKPSGGKANDGTVESDPAPKLAKSFDKSYLNPKKSTVKSTVKKGEFFK